MWLLVLSHKISENTICPSLWLSLPRGGSYYAEYEKMQKILLCFYSKCAEESSSHIFSFLSYMAPVYILPLFFSALREGWNERERERDFVELLEQCWWNGKGASFSLTSKKDELGRSDCVDVRKGSFLLREKCLKNSFGRYSQRTQFTVFKRFSHLLFILRREKNNIDF